MSFMEGPAEGGSADTLRPGTILGRYEIRRLLGQGGMGCVYEAQHRDLKKRVAIKTLLPALASNSDAKQRFLREGEAASRIRHPHVVDVTDLGSEGSVIYLVMEYLEGEDLARLLAREGSLSPTQAADILLPVAAAIATAHEQGVIHRDLKPENIYMARTAYGTSQPKVLDFGISKVLGDSRARALTGTAATMGTMHYLPPEQLRAAREADARSDQYGLGTILYECVTGQRAFDEESFYIILKKIAEGEFVRPSLRRPGLPPHMEAIILRAMSLEPLDRFESVRQFGAALLELASETTRMVWAPFFGPAPVLETPAPAPAFGTPAFQTPRTRSRPGSGSDRGRPGSGSDRGRTATLVESPAPAGGTMELPAPRYKSSSTTLRNATGERTPPGLAQPQHRWRAPLVVLAVSAVAAAATLFLLRGRTDEHRGDADQSTGIEPSPPPRAAAPPPEEARPVRAIPARPRELETRTETRPETDRDTNQATAPRATPGQEIAAPLKTLEPGNPRKAGARALRKAGVAKSSRGRRAAAPAPGTDEASPPPPSTEERRTANDAPVINP